MTADAGLGGRLARWLRGSSLAARRPTDEAVMLLEERIMLDAEAQVTIDGPATAPLGGSFAITLTFDNVADGDPGSNVGYGPYIDLIIPTTGKDGAGAAADDGITFGSATYLGVPVQTTLLTFDANGDAIHPFARDASGNARVVHGTPGDTLAVLTLPFGSFTPEQTAAVVTVNLNMSPLADYDPGHISDQLTLLAQGGFFLGRDPHDNPTTDAPVLQQPPVSLSVSPSLVTLTKVSNAPENETATGPNFLRTYTIDLDIATGQTITSLNIQDLLPANIVYMGSVVSIGSGTLVDAPAVGVVVDPADNLLSYDFGSVTGVAGVDARIVVSFYVADVAGDGSNVIDPVTGGDTQTINDVRATGEFTPIDGRDPVTVMLEDARPDDHILTNRAIAVQKSSSLVDNNSSGLSAGDVVIYTIQVQLSDYFTLGDINLTDLLSDGQRIDTSFLPTFTVTERGIASGALGFAGVSASGGEFGGGAFTTIYNSATGQTAISIDMSQELIGQNLFGGDGVLAGGRTQAGDAALLTGATTLSITFRAVVQAEYVSPQVNGQAVSQGDRIGNDVDVSATVRNNVTQAPTGNSITDDSHVSLVVPVGHVNAKEVVAVNGLAPVMVGNSPVVTQGDTVTFRITYALPNSSVDEFRLVDFLPLPVFEAMRLTQSTGAVGSIPDVGQWGYGTADSFHTLLNAPTPTVTADTAANSITFDFGSYSLQTQPGNPQAEASVVQILFTVRVTDQAFADQLQLTNLVTASEAGSQGNTVSTSALGQFKLSQPELVISKGVVDYLGSNSVTFDGSRSPPGVSFAGAVGNTGAAAFTGQITDAGLTLGAIDANLRGADAGDKLTFAIVINNNGTGRNGAFDVQFRDTLPAGFGIPTDGAGLNLKVTTGDGTPVAYALIGSGLFDGGIRLTDPSASSGAIAPDQDGSGTSGTSTADIIIITYDLVALDSVQPRQTWTNEATLFAFAALPGGANFVFEDLSDTATVTTPDPTISKTVIDSSHSFTSGNNLAIGETVTFRITVTLPEGTTNNLKLSDVLPDSMASTLTPISATLVSVGSGISGAGIPAIGSSATLSGHTFSFDFGNVVNAGDNVASNNSIVFDVVARATDDVRNQRGDTATNSGHINWITTLEGGSLVAGALSANATVRMVAPDLALTKTVNPTTADGGDIVTYTLTVSNPAHTYGTTAFDLNLIDSDLASLGFSNVTITGVSSSGAVNAAATADAGGIVRVSADSLINGGSITVTFTAKVSDTVETGSTLTNVARITDYATLPGDDPNARVITNEPPASATLTIASTGITKQLITTSIGNDANPKVQIGETATFDIVATLPDGLTKSLVLRDVLPTGAATLNFVSAELISIGGNSTAGATAGGNISGSLLGVGSTGTLSGDGKTVSFALGDVYTLASPGHTAADQIIIRVTVVVPDVPENTASDDVVTNTAIALFSTGSRQATSSLDIIEPNLGIVKSAVPASVQAGDVISYSFTIRNNGDGIAFDVTVADPLHPDIQRIGDISFSGIASGTATSFADIQLAQLRPGESLTVSYQALVLDTASHGTNIVNTASTSYDSLPGTDLGRVPSPPPSSSVSIPVVGPVLVDKALIFTSVNGDTSPNVVIGELLTYQIVATLPNGTISLNLRDVLPAGLEYVVGSASFVSAFGSSTVPAGFAVSVSGQQVDFAFGSLVNPPDPGGDDRVIVTLQALVRDVPLNFQGVNLVNPVTAITSLGSFTDPTPPVVSIVEPRLDIDKAASVNGGSAGDAGDLVSFTVTVRHSGTSGADARDFTIADLLPTGLTLVGTPTLSGTGAPGAAIDPSAPANSIRVTGATLAMGQELVIHYQARIDDTNLLPSAITNSASVGWDSLPGSGGRVDSGLDTATIDVTGPQSLVKSITGTSDSLTGSEQFDPAVPDLVIGERVDFRLVATIPEGVLGPVIITDTLLSAFGTLDLVPGSVQVEIGGVAISFTPTVTDTNGDGIGDRLLFDFGTIALPGDNDPSNNHIIISYSALVPDVAANFAAPGRVQLLPATLDTPLGLRADQVSVEIVEPELVLDKTASATTGIPGDVITYRLVLTHAGNSTAAARDILLTDDLSTGDLTLVPGSLVVLSGPGSVSGSGVSISIPTLALGEETIVEYRAIVGTVPPGASVPNIAQANFDSAEGPGGRPDSASDTFTFGVPNLNKVITGSSLADTGDEQYRPGVQDLAIGELLFYDIIVTLPDGDTGVLVTDRLLSLGAFGTLELVGAPTIAIGSGVTASIPNPTLVQTDTNGDGIADRLAWDFGTVNFTGSGDNHIIISVVARVPDVPGNSSGDLLTLPANLDYVYGNVVDSIRVDFVEPELGIEKIVTPVVGEAGTVVGYQVTLRNLGTGPAYDMALADLADAGLLPEGPATLLQGGSSTLFASANDVVVARLLPGEVAIISYAARIADSVLVDSVLPNTVSTGYDSLPGADAGQRSYAPVADDAVVTVTPVQEPTLTKAIPVPPTSDPNTGDAQLRPGVTDFGIGETGRIELTATLPHGTVQNVTLTDQLTTADAKLGFLPGSVSISLGGTLLDPASYTVTLVDSDNDGIADSVSFHFNSLTVPGAADPATYPLVIHYEVMALDIPANQSGDQLDLAVSLTYETANGAIQPLTASAGADIVEPGLGIEKIVTPMVGEAGVLVGYQVTIRNHGNGPAYDMVLTDVQAAGLLPEGPVTLLLNGVSTQFASINDVVIAGLLPGEVAIISYAARVADGVLVDSVLPNTISTGYDSLPGTETGQREYGPVTDDAAVTVTPSTQPALVKSIPVPPTSDANTGDAQLRPGITDLGIGETAQIELAATLPRGTIQNVTITDQLTTADAKLGFLPGSVSVSLGGIVLDPASYTVTLVDADNDGIADSVSFHFASLTVPGAADPATYPLVIHYEVMALDIPANQGGDQLDLAASLTYDTANGSIQPLTASAGVDLVQPDLTLTKTAVKTVADSGSLHGLLPPAAPLSGTAGDIFTYTITVGQAPGSTGPAYDLAISDLVPNGLSIVPGSVVASMAGVNLSVNGNNITAQVALLLPGESFTISYQARILDSTMYDSALPNHVDLGYDTLAGPGGRADSAAADAQIFLQGAGTVVKTVIATSNPNSGTGAFEPDVTDLTIGEEVTTRLTAVLAEGTTHVVITDHLPAGPGGVLQLIALGRPVLGANVIAEHPNPEPTLFDTDGDGLVDSFRFDFGRVTVLGDNVIDARDTISIDVTARVPDDPRNVSGNRLDAPVLLDFGTGTAVASVPLDIVEPTLRIDKIALTPDRFLGQIASYEIRVYHSPDSVVAADVAVIDTLAPGLTLVPGSMIIVSAPESIPVSIQGTTVSIPLLPLGTELVIRFDAQIAYTVDPTVPLLNTATVTWDQVPGEGGRPAGSEDTASVNVLPGDVPKREQPSGHWLKDRHVERLPRIDGIYSGTAQSGARLVLSLVDSSGAPAGSTAVTADAGGNWIALMPSATMQDRHDWQDSIADSRLFRDLIHAEPASPQWDADRAVRVGAYVPDTAYRLTIDQLSAGHIQPDSLLGPEPANNLRTYFAPAWRDELLVQQPLSIDRVFDDLAQTAISRDFAAAKEPLGFALNRFNAELLAAGVGAEAR
ncbi:DUF11 domain-containing protein [Sandaracinobacter neustonicus]|uniref:DUF11 domain-containing protein n=1 Tax=Sandaracinobacter neustonicus TaxID=1715348 RepID=A0A501XI21_9SPHN|nr:DUF11 domain-containing protein [Sandaracinobacter neustonicus]TPE60186.1 DUF11 domain-containing protein [Sandaracinobacter neustonicus]